MAAHPPADNVTTTQVFLAVSAVLNLALYPMVSTSWPDAWDPLGARVVLTAMCTVALVATWVPGPRRHASTIGLIAGCALQLWYLHISHVNGLIVERALNALMLVVVAIVFCRHLWQLAAFVAVTVAGVAWAYLGPIPADMPQFVVQTAIVVIGVGTGLAIHYRYQLEDTLAGQTAHAYALSIEVERRRSAEQSALQASRAKSAFLAHMSHELRTPLTAILGYGEMVEEELVGTDAESLTDDVQRILHSGRHLLGLIDEVLDLARIEAGKVELRPEAVDLGVLVGECLELVEPSATAGGNRLEQQVPEGVSAFVDAARLRQVLLNLLSNAIKFTRKGTISVGVRQDGPHAVLTVRDTGCGIPPDALPTLFDPFVMVDGDRREEQGTGLGLAICRELADRMDGALRADSALGVGSVFTLTLPTYSASQSTTLTV